MKMCFCSQGSYCDENPCVHAETHFEGISHDCEYIKPPQNVEVLTHILLAYNIGCSETEIPSLVRSQWPASSGDHCRNKTWAFLHYFPLQRNFQKWDLL